MSSFTFKRCASILVADHSRGALLDELAPECADPAEVIRGEYGDERKQTGIEPLTGKEGE